MQTARKNLLFDEVEAHPDPAYLQVAVQFYADLQHWTDAALEAADFSRQEVLDGLAAVKELYEKRAGGQKAKNKTGELQYDGISV